MFMCMSNAKGTESLSILVPSHISQQLEWDVTGYDFCLLVQEDHLIKSKSFQFLIQTI